MSESSVGFIAVVVLVFLRADFSGCEVDVAGSVAVLRCDFGRGVAAPGGGTKGCSRLSGRGANWGA